MDLKTALRLAGALAAHPLNYICFCSRSSILGCNGKAMIRVEADGLYFSGPAEGAVFPAEKIHALKFDESCMLQQIRDSLDYLLYSGSRVEKLRALPRENFPSPAQIADVSGGAELTDGERAKINLSPLKKIFEIAPALADQPVTVRRHPTLAATFEFDDSAVSLTIARYAE